MRWKPPEEIQNTVSPDETVGITEEDRDPETPPQNTPDGITERDRQRPKHTSTVSLSETLISYHEGRGV